MTRSRTRMLLLASLATVLVVALSAGIALAVDGNLPGGTSISVDITAPPDGDVKVSPPGVVDLTGTAAIGTGVPVANTAIIYVIDHSGSTSADCAPPAGGDTILTCEKQAALNLNAIAAGSGTVGSVAVVEFDNNANTVLGFTNPSSSSVATAINSLVSAGGTSFATGLAEAVSLLPPPAGITNTIIVFMSDGENLLGPSVNTVVVPPNVIIKAFAVGTASNCTSDPSGFGSLNELAARGGTGSDCTPVPDASTLPDVVPGVISSMLTNLTLVVDGGPPLDISASATPPLPQSGPASVAFGPVPVPLAPGVHQLCVTAHGSDGGGTGSVTECIQVTMVTLTLAPVFAMNELGTPGQTHTVTATVAAGPAGGVAGQTVNFDVTAGPNAAAPNASVPTNASGQASFTYTAVQGLAGLGTDTITATIGPDSQGDSVTATARKLWQDTTPPRVACTETVNPHGKNIPPAGSTTLPGPKGGQNEDGFYRMTATDAVDPNPRIWVGTAASPLLFGPFASGVALKITEAPGATPSSQPMGSSSGEADAITAHIKLNADPLVTAVDASGNSATATCLVPPPPK